MKKVFLGGTCNESTWRDRLIEHLDTDYFNPVVEKGHLTHECMAEEIRQRESCDFCLYVLTPKMTTSPNSGIYSIAEVVDDSNKRPEKTLFLALASDGGRYFSTGQMESIEQVRRMVSQNGAQVFRELHEVAFHLNNQI